MKVAEYSDAEKKTLKKRLIVATLGILIILLFSVTLEATGGFGLIPERLCKNLSDFATGLTFGGLLCNMLYLNGSLEKIRAWKLSLFKASK